MQQVTVLLGNRSYPITISSGLLNNADSFWPLKQGDNAMFVTNQTLESLYLDKLLTLLNNAGIKVGKIILPDGEQYKTLTSLNEIFTALLRKKYDRDTTLIALGGGVIGDLTGFAAASYQRGVRLIQVPTTLLSQVDSSVGGKTSVNHLLGKNMIGAFYQPSAVIIDTDCLSTLPHSELTYGLAEVIKYGIIIDKDFFIWLEHNIDAILALDKKTISYCIRRCCDLKAKIVTDDERECNIRMLLNLGHTFAHAIEAHMGYGTWPHGKAVSVGIVMAARTAERLGEFSTSSTKRIINLLCRAGLPIYGPSNMKAEEYLPYMMRDKKIRENELCLVLPFKIGNAEVRRKISHHIVFAAIKDCQEI